MRFLEFVQTFGFLVEEASIRDASVNEAGASSLFAPNGICFKILEEFCFDLLPRLGVGERVYGTGSDRGLHDSAVSNYADIRPEMLMLPLGVHEASTEFLDDPILLQ